LLAAGSFLFGEIHHFKINPTATTTTTTNLSQHIHPVSQYMDPDGSCNPWLAEQPINHEPGILCRGMFFNLQG